MFPLLFRRLSGATLIPLLVGLVLGLDLAWDLLVGSAGTIAYGLVDEPAHLATCAIALLALAAVTGGPVSRRFAVAALVACVAIDLDHLPGYLGWEGITGGTPRPYSHCALAVLIAAAAGLAARGRFRPILLGIAFGFGAHLLRDLATGPGVPLLMPLSSAAVKVPYVAYALCLVLAAAFVTPRAVVRGLRRPPSPLPLTGVVCLAAVGLLTFGAALGSQPAAGAASVHAQKPKKHGQRKHKQRRARSRIAVGVYVPGADRDISKLDEYASSIGRWPAIVHTYRYWSDLPFESAPLNSIASVGAMPLVTWEPWEGEGSTVSLWSIAAGEQDAYISASARQAAAWGQPLFVRFAHEMNGNWYPWGTVGDNTPVAYKSAWKHIVAIFRREGAANVRWVWTPYVDAGGHFPFRRYYPGDDWVDWVGFDGFNWGARFASFAEVFDDSYKMLARMTPKPMMIAETGSVEGGGRKAEWIRRALSRALPRLPHVRALVWWSDSHPDGADLRIDTSPASLAALVTGLQAQRFKWGSSLLLSTPRWARGR